MPLLLSASKANSIRPKLLHPCHWVFASRRLYDTAAPGYEVNANAEPLLKYQLGGYHPIHLGAQFKYGRYRVTHKLGWGGEGTVWLARDLQAAKLVALKVLTADVSGRNAESALLKQLFSGVGTLDHPGTNHLTQLLDSFWHTGPNGTHECLVLDIAGTNAQDQAQTYADERLPARAAWSIAKQIVLALDRLHTLKVAHADLHTRNIMLSPTVKQYADIDLLTTLPKPWVADINALPPNELNQHMPKYLVESTSLPYQIVDPSMWHAQLVDFGQSFNADSVPKQSRTPLVLRAPELILLQAWDYRVDIWSLACTIFELVTGKAPFDPVESTPNRLIQEWTDLFGDLPEGWRRPWGYTSQWGDDEQAGITGLLKEYYYEKQDRSSDDDDVHEPRFGNEDLENLGDLLGQMFEYKPEERISTREILAHKWFTKSPFQKSEAPR